MVSSKACKKCGEPKAIDEFYKHTAMADGYLNVCKQCTKERVKLHRLENIDKVREYDRSRGKKKERMAASYAVTQRWRARDSRITAAHNKVSRALKAGLISKQPCTVCGADKSYAHHESYNAPLDVIWYCQIHHKERHKLMAIEGIDPFIMIDAEFRAAPNVDLPGVPALSARPVDCRVGR